MLVKDMLQFWERLAGAFIFLYPRTLKPIVLNYRNYEYEPSHD